MKRRRYGMKVERVEPHVPDVDLGVLLLVQHELGTSRPHEASAIAQRSGVSTASVRAALTVLEPSRGPAPPAKKRPSLEGVEVLYHRRPR